MSPDPWRRRCPEGHASLVVRTDKATYRCNACLQTYEGTPYDAKETSFPVIE